MQRGQREDHNYVHKRDGCKLVGVLERQQRVDSPSQISLIVIEVYYFVEHPTEHIVSFVTSIVSVCMPFLYSAFAYPSISGIWSTRACDQILTSKVHTPWWYFRQIIINLLRLGTTCHVREWRMKTAMPGFFFPVAFMLAYQYKVEESEAFMSSRDCHYCSGWILKSKSTTWHSWLPLGCQVWVESRMLMWKSCIGINMCW